MRDGQNEMPGTVSWSRAAELQRMQRWAGGLLLAAAALAVLGHVRHWPWLQAFAEAALVGGLADWFAVVALFRHPLGVPIPHTAIVPRNKVRVASGLSGFIVTHFLDEVTVRQRLQQMAVSAWLADWLSQPVHRQQLMPYLRQGWLRLLAGLEQVGMQQVLLDKARQQLQRMDFSGLMAGGLQNLIAQQVHYRLLHAGLLRFAEYVEAPDNAEKIAKFIKGWSDNAWIQGLMEPFIPGIRTAVAERVRAVAADETGVAYREFDSLVQGYVAQLQQHGTWHDRLNQHKDDWLSQPELAVQLSQLWQEVLDALRQEAMQVDSQWQARMEALLSALESHLAGRHALSCWLDAQVRQAALNLSQRSKGQLGEWMAAEIMLWDNRYLVRQLELHLGRDLQFIRMNGTLVGGVLGLLIYALGQWLG